MASTSPCSARDGRSVAAEQLGTGDFGDLALARDGSAIASWADQPDPTGPGVPPPELAAHAVSAMRAAGDDRFGPPEVVSADGEDARPPGAAFDPVTGAPAFLWFAARADGSVLELSVRAP